MIQLLQAAIDSTKTTISMKGSHSYWMWIALGELIIILFLITKWKTHSKDAQAKQKFKSEALHGEIDFDNVITSSFHANELYDKLKKTCHPDRFTSEEQRVIADQLFHQITQNRRDYKKLVELQHEAENKLHIQS